MMEKIQDKIISALHQVFDGAEIDAGAINVQTPPTPEMGDAAVPLFPLAKMLQKSPQEIAEAVRDELAKTDDFQKVEAVSGFVNLWFKDGGLFSELKNIVSNGEKWLQSDSLKGQKIMVEYSSPNTNKPLTVGHARNNFIGMAVSNILELNGAEVVRAQIYNDRGVHICMAHWMYREHGQGQTPATAHEKPDHFVGMFYVQYNRRLKEGLVPMTAAQEMLRAWEAGDPEVRAIWKKLNDWVYEGWAETYSMIGSRFDKVYYESDLYNKGRDMVLDALNKGIVQKLEDGAVEVDLTDVGLDKKILLRRDGTTVYMTQDLETTRRKFEEMGLDQAMWVVADEQKYHFQVLFELCERFGIAPRDKCHHLAYGMVELPTGKMSSRSGVKVDLDNWLADVKTIATEVVRTKHPDLRDREVEERARQITLGATKFQLLKNSIPKKVIFDPHEAVSFEGATGPYVQYAHARICSIFREAGSDEVGEFDPAQLGEKQEKELMQMILDWRRVIERSAQRLDPAVLANWLLELAQTFSGFYAACPVLKAGDETKKARLALCRATQIVLEKGLNALGIEAPERM